MQRHHTIPPIPTLQPGPHIVHQVEHLVQGGYVVVVYLRIKRSNVKGLLEYSHLKSLNITVELAVIILHL